MILLSNGHFCYNVTVADAGLEFYGNYETYPSDNKNGICKKKQQQKTTPILIIIKNHRNILNYMYTATLHTDQNIALHSKLSLNRGMLLMA